MKIDGFVVKKSNNYSLEEGEPTLAGGIPLRKGKSKRQVAGKDYQHMGNLHPDPNLNPNPEQQP